MFYRERLNGYYGVGVFILSNFFSSLPFLISISAISGTITFFMVKYEPVFSRYVFFCLNLFGAIAMVESVMMIIASLVPNFLMGIIAGAGVLVSITSISSVFCSSFLIHVLICSLLHCLQGIMMMTAGFFRLLPDLPKVFWRYPISYIGYGAWSLQVHSLI